MSVECYNVNVEQRKIDTVTTDPTCKEQKGERLTPKKEC